MSDRIGKRELRIRQICCMLFLLALSVACGLAPAGSADVPTGVSTADRARSTEQLAGDEEPDDETGDGSRIPATAFDPAGLLVGPGERFVVLDDPAVVPAAQATWLAADDLVMGVEWNGEARAYPVSQMAYHHIANDTVGGKPFLVTY